MEGGRPPPWRELEPPEPQGKTDLVWCHTVFLGVYDLEAKFQRLHAAFGEDRDAYDEHNAELSACAAVLVSETGQLIVEAATGRVLRSGVRLILRGPGREGPEDGLVGRLLFGGGGL